LAELLFLAGSSTRLKILYVLGTFGEVVVVDLAELLGVSASVVVAHLKKLEHHGMVAARRDRCHVHYRLTKCLFNRFLREDIFPQFGGWEGQ
jgi:DNA-binding transcriptional ArsR family regulator